MKKSKKYLKNSYYCITTITKITKILTKLFLGHFWTVVRDKEDKQGSSRRRSRGTRLTRSGGGKLGSRLNKKNRNLLVDCKTGIASDESEGNSPMFDLARKESLGLASVCSAPQLHRPVPSYLADLQQQPNPLSTNLLAAMALNQLANTAPATPTTSVGSPLLNNGTAAALLSRLHLSGVLEDTNNTPQPVHNALSPLLTQLAQQAVAEQQRQLINNCIYQQQTNLVQQLVENIMPTPQPAPSPAILLAQLLLNRAQQNKSPVVTPQPVQEASPQPSLLSTPVPNEELTQQLLNLVSQQISQGQSGLVNSVPNVTTSLSGTLATSGADSSSKDNMVAI